MDIVWDQIVTHVELNINHINFWSGIKVWLQRPHILNRRLIGIDVLETLTIKNVNDKKDYIAEILELSKDVQSFSDFKTDLVRNFDLSMCHDFTDETPTDCRIIQIRKLLPKSYKMDFILEIVFIDYISNCIVFFPTRNDTLSNVSPNFPYKIAYRDHSISLELVKSQADQILQENNGTVEWLKEEVVPKICRWSQVVQKTSVLPSLSKIAMSVYSRIYQDLKVKYGRKLVESWPERTDPSKFVYEDISIAAYLMTLWEEERKNSGSEQKQSFVDIGCGNGLLVHLLSSEGHPGIGIDIRKRKIWDFYGPDTKLVEQILVPSNSVLFPEYDWLIGNHSDELTPWIPLIAARSSYKTKVFLLPCCAFTFDGKYDRGNSSISKYESYLDFVDNLCSVVGFNVHRDRLRIPSTKRVCFICSGRNYEASSEPDIEEQRLAFIAKHSKVSTHKVGPCGPIVSPDVKTDDLWSSSFTPRDKVEPVRNCCSLDPEFLTNTVVKIMTILLDSKENYVQLKTFENRDISWNAGGTQRIGELVSKLKNEDLSKLKSQCGGLQTLLRNHRNVFNIQGGLVSLSLPSKDLDEGLKQRKKQKIEKAFPEKPCIFYFHHPDGCPYLEQCKFSHANT